jgi:hypothetical protein
LPGAENVGLLAGSYVTYASAAFWILGAPKAPNGLAALTWYSILAMPEVASAPVSVSVTGSR